MLRIPTLQSVYKNIPGFVRRSYSHSKHKNSSMLVKDIVKTLQSYAPLTLAESWDNVGLLVDPMTNNNVNTVLLTNDLTEDVVDEAIKFNSNLIITYHPNIFRGLKTISAATWKERIIVQCIKNGIAVFSPHTSWDSVEGGVNDWLAAAFNFKTIKPIRETAENPRQGSGRLLILETPICVHTAVEQVKKHIGTEHLRIALGRRKGMDSLISSVALCAGSGSSVLNGVQADLYLTGEMSHHDVLDAAQNGIHVILCEHSNSERGFLEIFQRKLKEMILPDDVKVILSELDKDPLITV